MDDPSLGPSGPSRLLIIERFKAERWAQVRPLARNRSEDAPHIDESPGSEAHVEWVRSEVVRVVDLLHGRLQALQVPWAEDR